MWENFDLVAQETKVTNVVDVSFVVAWAVVDKIFEVENFVQQAKRISAAKVVKEARASRALEHSTSDYEHTEIEKVTLTYM